MSDDRRAALEAAFEAAENEGTDPGTQALEQNEVSAQGTSSSEAPQERAAPQEEAPEGEQVEPEAKATETPAEETPSEEPAKPVKSTDTPPASWKAPQRAKWAALDPDIRAEVMRREQAHMTAIGEAGNAKNFIKQFGEVVAPYAPRLQALGAHPLAAVKGLLQADYMLATGPKHQRAELIAKLIKDYDVDIAALDQVLAGISSPEAAEEIKLQRLLDQKLAPLQEKLTRQEQRELYEKQQQEAELAKQLEKISTDPKFPHFEAVRDTMADLIEISARRGVSLGLEEAYNRAVVADPSLSSSLEAVRQQEAVKQAALRAQRAKQASSSVNGAPGGGGSRSPVANDRRSAIAAAFEALGGSA